MPNGPTEPPQPPVDKNDDAAFTNAFIERARQMYKDLQDNRSDLLDLYNKGNHDAFGEKIDELADDLMTQDVTYEELRAKLRDARSTFNGKLEKEIVAQIRALQENYRNIIVVDLNLPDEARLSKLDQAALTVKDFLKEQGFDGTSTSEALKILGIAIPQDDGKTAYQFPSEFMPEEVVTKWETYLSTVIAHYRAVHDLSEGNGGSQGAVMEADRTRKYAHDSVTKDVHRILGLEGIGDWDVSKTRALLANIREAALPNEGVLLSDESKKLLDDNHGHVAASRMLSDRHHS